MKGRAGEFWQDYTIEGVEGTMALEEMADGVVVQTAVAPTPMGNMPVVKLFFTNSVTKERVCVATYSGNRKALRNFANLLRSAVDDINRHASGEFL